MTQKIYPTVSIAVFSTVCVVLAALGGSISDPSTAAWAVGIPCAAFGLGLWGFQIRAGWIRQNLKPRKLFAIVATLVCAAVAGVVAIYLYATVSFRSWWGLPVVVLGAWGGCTLADRIGALCRILRNKANPVSDATSDPVGVSSKQEG